MDALQGMTCLHLHIHHSWPGTYLPQTPARCFTFCGWYSLLPLGMFENLTLKHILKSKFFSHLLFPQDFSRPRCFLISTGRGINTWTSCWVVSLDVMVLRTRCYLHTLTFKAVCVTLMYDSCSYRHFPVLPLSMDCVIQLCWKPLTIGIKWFSYREKHRH